MVELLFGRGNFDTNDIEVLLIPRDSLYNNGRLVKNITQKELNELIKAIETCSLKDEIYFLKKLKVDKKTFILVSFNMPVNKMEIINLGRNLSKKLCKYVTACICFEKKHNSIFSTDEFIYNLALGLELDSYRFDKYNILKAETYSSLETVVFDGDYYLEFQNNYKPFKALANCIRYARDIYNEPRDIFDAEEFFSDVKRLKYLDLVVKNSSLNNCKTAIVKWQGNDKAEQVYYACERGSAAILIAVMKYWAIIKKNVNVCAVINMEANQEIKLVDIQNNNYINHISNEEELIEKIINICVKED